ncbi:hypothetical protein N2152v2_006511 [Parachlorella kessleri]
MADSTVSCSARVRAATNKVSQQLRDTGDRLNAWAAENVIGRWFHLKERQAKFCVECRAGFITFLMVSYVLAVNPNILIATGGTCNPQEVCSTYATAGPACLWDANDMGAQACLGTLKANLITATAASSLIATFLMGLMANLPLALAPGIGISAYVSYQVVGQFGEGRLTYEQAMTAIFVEGWIFLILSVTGVRGGLVKYMPKSVAMASSVGIGLLLAFTGLQNLGVIAFDNETYVALGGCSRSAETFIYSLDYRLTTAQLQNLSAIDPGRLPIPAAVHGCSGGTMGSATMWLGIAGGVLMALLMSLGVKGGLVIGIFFVTIISWIPGHAASYLGEGSAYEGGAYRMQTFKQVVAAPSLSMTGLAWDWSAFGQGQLWLALLTFLYIDLLDCTGTLLSMASLLDQVMPGFMSSDMEFPGQMWAFLSDGVGILAGSMMGSTPDTVYIESAAGIEDGGRTGLTAIVVSFLFFVALFFSPILASIPPYATGPALVLVACNLLAHTSQIPWDDVRECIPAFLTIIVMPFTYSVAYGVIAGLASYIVLHLPFWGWDLATRLLGGSGGEAGARLRARVPGPLHQKVFLPPHRPGSGGGSSAPPSIAPPDGSLHGGSFYEGSLHNGRHAGGKEISFRAALDDAVDLTHGGTYPGSAKYGAAARAFRAGRQLVKSSSLPWPGAQVNGLGSPADSAGPRPSSFSHERSLHGLRQADSAWMGSWSTFVSSSRHPGSSTDVEQGVAGGSARGRLVRMQSSGSWVSASPPSPLQMLPPGPPAGLRGLRRSNSYADEDGGAGVASQEELYRRAWGSSNHGGSIYPGGGSTPGGSSPGTARPSFGLAPALEFSGGSFRLAGRGGQQPPGAADWLPPGGEWSRDSTMHGAQACGPGFRRASSLQTEPHRLSGGPPLGPGGSSGPQHGSGAPGWREGRLRSPFTTMRSASAVPALRQATAGSQLGSGGGQRMSPGSGGGSSVGAGFKLFGDVDVPVEGDMEAGLAGERDEGHGSSSSGFKLFGDVELPPSSYEEGGEAAGASLGRNSSFKLFGDVQLPPDGYAIEPDDAGEGADEGGEATGLGRSSSFKLFGDVELPPESFEDTAEEAGGGDVSRPSIQSFGSVELPMGGAALSEGEQLPGS